MKVFVDAKVFAYARDLTEPRQAGVSPWPDLPPVGHRETTETAPVDGGRGRIELVMWLIMRGALGGEVREVYRATHLPTSNTHNGLLVLERA